MTDRPTILALAAEYDTAPTKIARHVCRTRLCNAIEKKINGEWWSHTPSTAYILDPDRAVRLWVAASRRAAKNPTRRKGPVVPPGRTERISVPATPATKAAIEGHAERVGRSVATVAGDVLETATQALRGEGGSHE